MAASLEIPQSWIALQKHNQTKKTKKQIDKFTFCLLFKNVLKGELQFFPRDWGELMMHA